MKTASKMAGVPESFLKIHLDSQTLKTKQIRQFMSLWIKKKISFGIKVYL